MKNKYNWLIIIFVPITILYFIWDPNSINFPKCPLYATTGILCPGCGSQRAFHELLHLNITGILRNNILFFAGVLVGLYELSILIINHYYDKKMSSIFNQKKGLMIILLLVIVYWILRNIPIYPFTLFVPN